MTPISRPSSAQPIPGAKTGKLRWYICGLLFFATTVNYMDRQVLGILKPVRRAICTGVSRFRLDHFRVPAFLRIHDAGGRPRDGLARHTVRLCARGAGLESGINVARDGAKRIPIWSCALRAGHRRISQFPCGRKDGRRVVSPTRTRACTGLFNSGSNLGAIAAPLVVPFVARALAGARRFSSPADSTLSGLPSGLRSIVHLASTGCWSLPNSS